MLKPFLFVVFLCIAVCCRGNDIDKLHTLDDVKAFLKHLAKNDSVDFFGGEKKDSAENLSKVKFLKIDVNNDGLTDLLINGTDLFVLIDDGHNNFFGYYIDKGTFLSRKYVLVDIDSSQNQPKIIIKNYDRHVNAPSSNPVYDTLIVKYNGFVEYTNKPEVNKIKEIAISTTTCFGTCPVYDLAISADGSATFNAKRYLKKKGLFNATIDKTTLADLFALTNYIRISSLKDNYAVNWTDDQTIILTVTFIDGSSKTINDYGMIGTFGLENLYDSLRKIRSLTKWEHI